MPRRAIHSDQAPAAVGPYSQAARIGDLLFLSGQIGLEPGGSCEIDGDLAAQARQALDNLSAVLAAAGASWADVIKTTIYLTDLASFATVNEIYAKYVGSPPPARATVEVSGLPKGAAVEIDAVARLENER